MHWQVTGKHVISAPRMGVVKRPVGSDFGAFQRGRDVTRLVRGSPE